MRVGIGVMLGCLALPIGSALAQQPNAPIQGGLRTPIPRQQTETRERDAGIAADPRREAEQLRELNELSRTLAPGVPPPAPQAEPPPRGTR